MRTLACSLSQCGCVIACTCALYSTSRLHGSIPTRLHVHAYSRTPSATVQCATADRSLHGLCVPIFAFDSDEDGGNDGGSGMAVQRTSRPRNCGVRQRTLCTPEWDKQVQLHRIKDHFIFSVETTGSLPPEVRLA